MGDDRQTEGDSRAHGPAGDDIAADHDRLVGEEGAALCEQVIPGRIAGGGNAPEQAQLSEDAGSGADGRDLLSVFAKSSDLVHELIAGPEIRGPGDASRQDQHVVIVEIQGPDRSVGPEGDLVGGGDLGPVIDGDFGAGDPGPVEKVDDGQPLDLFAAVGKENGGFFIGFCFKHFFSIPERRDRCLPPGAPVSHGRPEILFYFLHHTVSGADRPETSRPVRTI